MDLREEKKSFRWILKMIPTTHSPPHISDVLGRHVEHGVWQMLLRKVLHQQNVVYRVLDARQMVHANVRPGQYIGTVLGHQEGDTHPITEILVAANWRDVRRLETNALKRNWCEKSPNLSRIFNSHSRQTRPFRSRSRCAA